VSIGVATAAAAPKSECWQGSRRKCQRRERKGAREIDVRDYQPVAKLLPSGKYSPYFFLSIREKLKTARNNTAYLLQFALLPSSPPANSLLSLFSASSPSVRPPTGRSFVSSAVSRASDSDSYLRRLPPELFQQVLHYMVGLQFCRSYL
jgi:hypothetical protein